MSILTRAVEDEWRTVPPARVRQSELARKSQVTPEQAMTQPTAYACVSAISEDIAKSPFQMFKDLEDDGDTRARDERAEYLLREEPNPWQTPFEFVEMLTAFAAMRKFGIARIVPTPGEPIGYLEPLHPDLVREESTATARRFVYRDPRKGGEETTLQSDEVLVVRGKMSGALIDFARNSFAQQMATDEYRGSLLSRGPRIAGIVSRSNSFPNDNERKAFRAALEEYAGNGPRSGRPLLLEDGMTWSNAVMTARDMQLVDNLKWDVLTTCRWFRMVPSKIGDYSEAHYNNVEQGSIDYVVDTLLSWAVRWEQAIRRVLIVDKTFFGKFNLDALMRGDLQARSAAYALLVQWGILTRDEARAKENLSPLPGGVGKIPNLDVGHGQPGAPAAGPIAAPVRGQMRLLVSDTAARLVRREIAAVTKLAERAGDDRQVLRSGLAALYAEHADAVTAQLRLPSNVAQRYVAGQRTALLAHGTSVMDDWLDDAVASLTSLTIEAQEAA